MTRSAHRSALFTQVAGLAADAAQVVDGADAVAVAEIAQRMREPLRVAIAGRVKAGKSTLLNALVGDHLAPTDAGECTRIVTWYRHGITYRVKVTTHDGETSQVPFHWDRGPILADLGDLTIDDIERLTVEWPLPVLETLTLIDTPGIGSLNAGTSARTLDFLSPDDGSDTPSDAVLYLMRHLHTGDVDFLQAFHEDEYAQPSPVDCIGVLSRADEIGVGRADPIVAAAAVADRYANDQRVRRLVQNVVPVAGLLAQAGAAFREDDFRRLRAIAYLEQSRIEELLLSVDRFSTTTLVDAPSTNERAVLVEHLGMYGVRLAISLLRSGEVTTATALADELLARSGIVQLRDLLVTQFTGRRDLLKARAALHGLERLLAASSASGSGDLRASLDRVRSGAHELAELRLLTALRAGEVDLRSNEATEVDRLLGIYGESPRSRLGLDHESPDGEVRSAAIGALGKWRSRAENPTSSRMIADVSRVLVRSCEGIFASLPSAG